MHSIVTHKGAVEGDSEFGEPVLDGREREGGRREGERELVAVDGVDLVDAFYGVVTMVGCAS